MTPPILSYRATARGAVVDLTKLIASRLLVQANSGGGKSRAVRQLLEETHGRVMQLVIDPEGEFSTLREKFDYLLVAKAGGDAQASPKTAKLLCRRLVELGASAVLDISELPIEERRAFVRIFLTELMALPRTMWRPILVVIDEVHQLAPERGHGESQALESVITLATAGRKRGFCLVGATQRLSKLNKDVAAELLNKMIGRTGLDLDIKRAGDELGLDKEGRATLARLQPGEFYTYGPAIGTVVQLVRTGDVVTTHPEPGAVTAAAPPTPAKVRALAKMFADLPQEAAQEERSLADLEKRNRELSAELAKMRRSPGVVDPQAMEAHVTAQVEKAVTHLTRRNAAGMKGVRDRLVGYRSRLTSVADAIAEDVAQLDAAIGSPEPGAVDHPLSRRDAPAIAQTRQAAPPTASGIGDASIGKTPQRMLNALRFLESIGTSPASRAAVAGLVAISYDTGTFRNYLSDLRSAGFIADGSGGSFALTDAGRAQSSDVGLPATRDELHRAWLGKLGSTQARMLRILLDDYPESITREELGERCNISHDTGTFRNYLSDLRSPGLMVDTSKTTVRAADALFPDGLA